MNIHTPERLEGEPFDLYKQRRKSAHLAAARVCAGILIVDGRRHQHTVSTRSLERAEKRAAKQARVRASQQTKRTRERHHKPKASIPPTWPTGTGKRMGKDADQFRQSRPVIVMRPVRAARKAGEDAEAAAKAAYR